MSQHVLRVKGKWSEEMSTNSERKLKNVTDHTIPVRKTLHALQSLDILTRALQRSSSINSSCIILVIIVVVVLVLVVFLDIRGRSSIDFIVVIPIEHIGVGIRRMRISRRSLAYTAKVGGVVTRAPTARRICCGRRR